MKKSSQGCYFTDLLLYYNFRNDTVHTHFMTTPKYQNTYRISSARATWHDYDGGMYFVTICTKEMIKYFGEITDEKMELNHLGKYATKCIEEIPKHFPDTQVPIFVVMPNHIHAIICVDGEFNINPNCRDAACHVSTTSSTTKNKKMQDIANKCGRLSAVIGGLKSEITRFANLNKIPFAWQARLHDRIIRDKNECNALAYYIENNPINWHLDELNII